VNEPDPRFKWPVAVARKIEAPVEGVWEVISMPGNLEPCHPFCERDAVETWPGPGSRDEVHYLNGWIYQPRIIEWYEGIGYDLDIGRRGGRSSPVSWRVHPLDPEHSMLTICVYPFVLQHLPVFIRRMPHLDRVRPLLKRYLDSVTRGFEWFISRDEPVPRSQFGRHPWFSRARE
jgi:hypothetical protein